MSLNALVALLASAAIHANPSPSAIPASLDVPSVVSRLETAGPAAPVKARGDSFGIATSAKSVIVADAGSGAVLYAKDAEVARPIASLTKLVSAMVLLDAGLNAEGVLPIQSGDIEPIGRHSFNAGESLNRGTAFRAWLAESVNEIANAFADAYPGGREAFVVKMNEKANILGLKQAVFVDPSGISSKNIASATDVARILRSAIAYPEIRDATRSGAFVAQTLEGRQVKIDPTNNLLSSYLNQPPYGIVAGKTGSLPEAGYCLGQVTRHPDGQQVITVVLGSADHFSRFQEVKALTGWAFETYHWSRSGSQ